MTINDIEQSQQIDSIDAVRGVAVVLAIIFHWVGMTFGWTGADSLFSLNGYLDWRRSDRKP